MKKYKVFWTKTYLAGGEEIVEAEDQAQAELKIWRKLGELTGPMEYYPDEDWVTSIDWPHEDS